MRAVLHAFDNHRQALADANAQRYRRVAPAGSLQLPRHRDRQARTGCAERMPDRNRAAIRIDPRILEVNFH